MEKSFQSAGSQSEVTTNALQKVTVMGVKLRIFKATTIFTVVLTYFASVHAEALVLDKHMLHKYVYQNTSKHWHAYIKTFLHKITLNKHWQTSERKQFGLLKNIYILPLVEPIASKKPSRRISSTFSMFK